MTPKEYILTNGIYSARRIVDNNLSDWYSSETGSYYQENRNNSVSVESLRKSIIEYDEIMKAKENYERLCKLWNDKK